MCSFAFEFTLKLIELKLSSDLFSCFCFCTQVSWLDKIDRRYSWLKRALVKFDEDFQGTFPLEWHVEERISEEFCKLTKYD